MSRLPSPKQLARAIEKLDRSHPGFEQALMNALSDWLAAERRGAPATLVAERRAKAFAVVHDTRARIRARRKS